MVVKSQYSASSRQNATLHITKDFYVCITRCHYCTTLSVENTAFAGTKRQPSLDYYTSRSQTKIYKSYAAYKT